MVDRFVIEGIARHTIYNALNRRTNGQTILCDTRLGPRKNLKRLVNSRKGVSKPELNQKIYKNQTTIGYQIQKLGFNN